MLKHYRPILAAALALGVLTGCYQDRSFKIREEMLAKYGDQAQQQFEADFAKLQVVIKKSVPGENLNPRLHISGQSSKVIAPLFRTGYFNPPHVFGKYLARTDNGVFFTVEHETELDAWYTNACLKNGKCTSRMNKVVLLDTESAQRLYFDSDSFSPAGFKELFGVEAPAQDVKL